MRYFFSVFVLVIGLSSCVPAKKYNDLVEKERKCNEELTKFKNKALGEGAQVETLNARLDKLVAENNQLKSDTANIGNKYRELKAKYNSEQELRDDLVNLLNEIRQSGSQQVSDLSKKLEDKIRDNQKKEDELMALENELSKKEALLVEREKRVQELERIIQEQAEAVTNLKNKIAAALTGFEGKGLTVEERDGKVYVSLEAKLLFPSGSTAIAPEGKNALIDLAKALENEVDFEVIVEGHTDTDPLRSASHPKSNWELSVLRATAVIDIMLNNSTMNPEILMAAGRSEFHPVSSDLSKNRRIEVIIAPNLGDIIKLLSE
ncbi:MAG: OmpA family protein [Brumimicrobium sp.]